MDAVTDDATSDVVIMTSAQVGKSEVLLNILGYFIEHQPAPMMMLQPTLDMAEAFSKDRVAPMIRDTPSLSGLIADTRSRDSGNTLLHKQFRGGHITLAGANSAASLASRPIRVLLADEVDRYPVSAGTEGDPLALGEKRTQTFWNRKRIKCSTPTVKDLSRIEAAYNESDRRHYLVPCQHCDEPQVLKWAQVRWPEKCPDEAAYHCAHCGAQWTETERHRAVRNGFWQSSAPFRGVAGFHLNELYSPWSTLAKIANEFLAAKQHPERLRTFVNTTLGEVWEESREAKDPQVLRARAEGYELGTVPAAALVVVAAVDVQGDRLECYHWGYGLGEEAWVLDFRVFYGDPSHPIVWDQLLEHLGRPMEHELGARTVARSVAIDSGGLHTQTVYAFCRHYAHRNTEFGVQQILAIKGASEASKPIIGKPTAQDVSINGQRIPNGVQLWPVGSSSCKSRIYSRLSIEAAGPGFVHTSTQLPEEFFEQMVAERLHTKYVRGFPVLEWHLPKGKRNEALDCAVYAYAAACQLGLERLKTSEWESLRRRMTADRKEGVPEVRAPETPPPVAHWQRLDPNRNAFGQQRSGNFATNWRK